MLQKVAEYLFFSIQILFTALGFLKNYIHTYIVLCISVYDSQISRNGEVQRTEKASQSIRFMSLLCASVAWMNFE